jgi:hypothetical protein
MTTRKKISLLAILPPVLGGGLVDIRHVSDPGPELAKARAEVEDDDGGQVLVWLR